MRLSRNTTRHRYITINNKYVKYVTFSHSCHEGRSESVIIRMPILFLLIALLLPRVTIAVLWFFTQWFSGMFGTWVIPLLGFLFLPYTLLWYSIVQRWYAGTWGTWQIAVLIVAVIADVWSWGGVRRG